VDFPEDVKLSVIEGCDDGVCDHQEAGRSPQRGQRRDEGKRRLARDDRCRQMFTGKISLDLR